MIETLARVRMLLLVSTLLAPLAGCVTTTDRERACEMHEQQMRETKPITTYRVVNLKPGQAAPRALPAGSLPQAPTYHLTFKPGFTKPCTTITLHKDVVILRSNDNNVTLSEVREFYAEDGTLITTTTQNISDQVKRSGTYLATTPLPIPRNAPPGKYKIVSKLLAERRGDRRPTPVARAEGFFYIIPPQ
jgi:hypothetical protein